MQQHDNYNSADLQLLKITLFFFNILLFLKKSELRNKIFTGVLYYEKVEKFIEGF